LIAVSGQMMAGRFGGIGGAGWLTLGFALFIASGVIWITTLIPIQIMQARLARRFARDGAIPDRYWRLAALWYVLDMPTPLFPSDHTASTTTAPGRSARSRKRASTSRCNTWEATHLFRPRTYLDPDNVLVAQRKARGNLVDRVAHAGASPARDLRSLYC
jgi:hypothetical protein